VSSNTESVASRIDVDSKTKLELAVEESDTSMSAYLESVIEDHIEENPSGLRALASDASSDPTETNRPQQNEPEQNFVEQMLEGLE